MHTPYIISGKVFPFFKVTALPIPCWKTVLRISNGKLYRHCTFLVEFRQSLFFFVNSSRPAVAYKYRDSCFIYHILNTWNAADAFFLSSLNDLTSIILLKTYEGRI